MLAPPSPDKLDTSTSITLPLLTTISRENLQHPKHHVHSSSKKIYFLFPIGCRAQPSRLSAYFHPGRFRSLEARVMSLNFNRGIACATAHTRHYVILTCRHLRARYFMGLRDFYFSYEIYALNKINLYLKNIYIYIHINTVYGFLATRRRNIYGVRRIWRINFKTNEYVISTEK